MRVFGLIRMGVHPVGECLIDGRGDQISSSYRHLSCTTLAARIVDSYATWHQEAPKVVQDSMSAR